MERLDGRIGQRRDATRAPNQAWSGWRLSGHLLDCPPHHLRNGEILPKQRGVHLTIKPQEKTAGSVPHEAVPMKPDDILTPGQLAERLQVKW